MKALFGESCLDTSTKIVFLRVYKSSPCQIQYSLMELNLDTLQTVFMQTFENCPAISLKTKKEDIPSWDSMSHLNLILNLEETFGHSFSIEDIEQIKSVQDIFTVINK